MATKNCGKCGPLENVRGDFCRACGGPLTEWVPESTPESASTVPEFVNHTDALHDAEIIAEQDPAPSVRTNRLAEFMRVRGFRASGTNNDSASRETETASSPDSFRLPDAVTQKGWKTSGPLQSTDFVDAWPVSASKNGNMVHAKFSRYRIPVLTRMEMLNALKDKTSNVLPRVWDVGTTNLDGARATYDIITTIGHSLTEWLARGTPGENRALHLLPQLATLLQALHKESLRPLLLTPDMLRLRNDETLTPGGHEYLSLASVVALEDARSDVLYRPDLQDSGFVPAHYAAPEMRNAAQPSSNAAVFSIGQILAHAMYGEPFTHNDIAAGAIPFAAISDQYLASVLRGTLWPKSAGRWTLEELVAATIGPFRQLPATSAWEQLMPGAASTSFSLKGKSFWRLEELIAAALSPEHWDEAVARIEDIFLWAKATRWAGQVELARQSLHAGRSGDWVLLRLAGVVRPDIPASWRTLALDEANATANLVNLAQRALSGDKDARQLVDALFKADLRDALAVPNSN